VVLRVAQIKEGLQCPKTTGAFEDQKAPTAREEDARPDFRLRPGSLSPTILANNRQVRLCNVAQYRPGPCVWDAFWQPTGSAIFTLKGHPEVGNVYGAYMPTEHNTLPLPVLPNHAQRLAAGTQVGRSLDVCQRAVVIFRLPNIEDGGGTGCLFCVDSHRHCSHTS